MFYYLLYDRLYPAISGFRVFRYASRFGRRSLASRHFSSAWCFWSVVRCINRLREFQIGQYIREEGPKKSHQKESQALPPHGRRSAS